MLKLIKLELKKIQLRRYITGALIANIVILGLLILISTTQELNEVAFIDYGELLFTIDLMVRGTFIVYAAVLLSRLVISEFSNKSITVLFMYPVSRKKLILAKLLIVSIYTFVAVILSNILIASGFYIIDRFTHIVPGELTSSTIINSYISIGLRALATSGMCLIPLYFGMKKYSGSTTIISSLLVVLIVCSNNMGFSLSSIIAIPIGMGIVGAFIAYLAIRNIEHLDLN